MNGYGGAPPWQEAKAPDGRVYYYNPQTKVTQWTKPEELMTPAERALVGTPWKELKAADGKPYWWNTETKETTWEMPDVLKRAMQDQPPQRLPPQQQTFVAGGSASSVALYGHGQHREDRRNDDRYGGGDRIAVSIDGLNEPQFATPEEAEAAFMKVLKRVGVQPDWTWEQAVRAGIKDRDWRAVKDPKDREQVFKKYCIDVRAQEKDRERQRVAKVKSDFTAMLQSHPEIKYYTRWKTALPIISQESIFRSAKDDAERRQLFEEYIKSLKDAHVKNEKQQQQTALTHVSEILQSLDLEPYTRWPTVYAQLQENEQFLQDDQLKSLHKLDILNTFSEHIKRLEVKFNNHRQEQKRIKARFERKNRDAFIELLKDLKSAGRLRAGTKWKDIHPDIEDDPRYVAMLGQGGSTPLELFWDALEEEELTMRAMRNDAMDVLHDLRFEVTLDTPFEDFCSVMGQDIRTRTFDEEALKLLFARIREKVSKRLAEKKHIDERDHREAIEDLRHRIKRLEPPVAVGDNWEQVRPRLEKYDEFNALETDELRRVAFDKHMRRLRDRERDEEATRDRPRREHRDRDRRERERERDRGGRDRGDREYRNGHASSHRRHRTRTRSPEPDPYGDSRRKAQAEREARFRAGSTTGLSPPRRRRDDPRDRDGYGRRSREVSVSMYDGDRRRREPERDFVSRADPRDKANELDYGDSRPVTRRRRESGGERSPDSKRDNKRARREQNTRERTFSPRPDRRSKTPAHLPEPSIKEEEPAFRSGSEEGEIEED
ncbi:hypothetical protein GQ43DRAFT_442037 [Delitschia confertaspora ATCC 74209]|uniref:FF domain protein n=1 Tax=Delitschia confertaspora ATCC 74209 TaxID=1513339 RepID=A0A9P4JI85_9PLEO|nr:hypothetical protein GQ43DRAFT_442037 [Delitschia confertaspora ATCC 74209]